MVTRFESWDPIRYGNGADKRVGKYVLFYPKLNPRK